MRNVGLVAVVFTACAVTAMAALFDNGAFNKDVRSDMVFIPAGEAILGGKNFAQMPGPALRYVEAYWIDRYEVTNVDYATYTTDTERDQPLFFDDPAYNQPGQPVTGVTRFDAESYCDWAGKRLPTEREWEKAARGTDGRLYPWGNEEDFSRAHLDADAPIVVTDQPQDISPYGVVGMAGNVSEWVDEMFIGGPSCLNPDATVQIKPDTPVAPVALGEDDLHFKAYIRGNNIQGLPHMTKLAHHLWDYPDTLAEFVGFRCAQDAPQDAISEQAALK